MTQLPKWVAGINAIWLTLGTLVTLLLAQGVQLPAFLPGFLTNDFFQTLVTAGSAVFTAYQAIRVVLGFVPKTPDAKLSILRNRDLVKYAINPFKITP